MIYFLPDFSCQKPCVLDIQQHGNVNKRRPFPFSFLSVQKVSDGINIVWEFNTFFYRVNQLLKLKTSCDCATFNFAFINNHMLLSRVEFPATIVSYDWFGIEYLCLIDTFLKINLGPGEVTDEESFRQLVSDTCAVIR